ncbi:MAG: hypothetical protein VX519_03680 [Myxococcota bacterium]|nr:hypothetical protein [Myxococcota bacterium]
MTVMMGFLLLLAGCPESPDNLPDGSPAVQTEQVPGDPSAQPPGVAGEVPDPKSTQFSVDAEEGLTLSGTLSYAGDKTGTVLLQVLTIAANQPPSLMHHEEFEAPTQFSLVAPKNLGSARLISFLDTDDNGPSATDPAAMMSIEIGTEDLADLSLVLLDEPDLGDMTPGTDHSDALANPTPSSAETPAE